MNRDLMLLPHVLLPLYVGGAYAFADRLRFSSPAFNSAKAIAPMRVWGVILLLIGAAILAGLLVRARTDHPLPLSLALVAGAGFFAWWAVVQAFNAASTPTATPTGVGFVGWIALGYLVTGMQVARRRPDW